MNSYLYVADDIQPLATGKVLAVGLFTDLVVVVNAPEAPTKEKPGGVGLALMVGVSGVEPGEHKVKVTVFAPDGEPTKFDVEGTQDLQAGGSILVVIRCQPFIFTEVGRYAVRTIVDDGAPLENAFELRFVKIAAPPTEFTGKKSQDVITE